MRHILAMTGAAMVLFAGHLPTYAASTAPADAGPVVQNSRAMEAVDQIGPATSIRQQIENQLTKGGYTNVKIMPSSFLVRATDRTGNPVEMVIGPESVTAVTEIAPKPAAASDATTTMPKATAQKPASKS